MVRVRLMALWVNEQNRYRGMALRAVRALR
jgi:hypothetical protein